MKLSDLSARWRQDAELLEQYGAEAQAHVCRRHAEDLERALALQSDDVLDLATAASESGYSADRLRHMVADGTIPNAGRKGAPRIRRGDLPRKVSASTSADTERESATFDAAAVARSIVDGKPARRRVAGSRLSLT